ncbi:hypothetical protein LJC74_09735, partial [Eubacteriales bacterium OttesenSCG-928-A19]|nr:hypothetical protein [Eubacteriales bacterium OttesenSCG-928-A19]
MKAIIAEIRGSHAAALLEDGRLVRVPNRGYAVGQRVTLTPRKKRAQSRAWMGIAAMLVLVVGLSGGMSALYFQPAATISLDINPSLSMTLNRFLRVLSVEALNADGEAAIEALDLSGLRHTGATDAVRETIARLYGGYGAREGETYVVLSTSARDASRADAVFELAARAAEDASGGDLTVLACSAEAAEAREAQALGVTPGKLALVRALEASGADADEAYWLEQPVDAIIEQAAAEDLSPADPFSGALLSVNLRTEEEDETEEQPEPWEADGPDDGAEAVLHSATPDVTPSPTATATPTPMPSLSPSDTPTKMASAAPTASGTAAARPTVTSAATGVAEGAASASPTAVQTPKATKRPVATATATFAPTTAPTPGGVIMTARPGIAPSATPGLIPRPSALPVMPTREPGGFVP